MKESWTSVLRAAKTDSELKAVFDTWQEEDISNLMADKNIAKHLDSLLFKVYAFKEKTRLSGGEEESHKALIARLYQALLSKKAEVSNENADTLEAYLQQKYQRPAISRLEYLRKSLLYGKRLVDKYHKVHISSPEYQQPSVFGQPVKSETESAPVKPEAKPVRTNIAPAEPIAQAKVIFNTGNILSDASIAFGEEINKINRMILAIQNKQMIPEQAVAQSLASFALKVEEKVINPLKAYDAQRSLLARLKEWASDTINGVMGRNLSKHAVLRSSISSGMALFKRVKEADKEVARYIKTQMPSAKKKS